MIIELDGSYFPRIDIVWNLLSKIEFLEETNEIIYIDFRNTTFMSPCSIIALFSTLKQCILKGLKVEFIGNNDVTNYLARMNFFSNLGHNYNELFNRRDHNDRFLEISIVNQDGYSQGIGDRICSMIKNKALGPKENIEQLMRITQWAIGETIDNLRHAQLHFECSIHNPDYVSGSIMAQFFNYRNEIGFCLADRGIGLKGSIGRVIPDIDYRTSIEKALQKGFSTNDGMGNGLFFTKELMTRSGGFFSIISGPMCFWQDSESCRWYETPQWNGTLIFGRYKCNNSFDDTTLIGGTGYPVLLNFE